MYSYITQTQIHCLDCLDREFGAVKRIRTLDLLITSQLLYQLSYDGK